jgi:hypothetical protein
MSKEFPQFSENEPAKTEISAKPKRSATTRVKKTVPAGRQKRSDEPKPEVAEIVRAPVAQAKVAVVENEVVPAPEPEWSDTAPESVGGASPVGEGGSKRKRRRRKGKGGGSSAPVEGAEAPLPAAPVPQSGNKPRLDSEALAKAAWKIYLAEVSEEGVALVGDQDARELARRCFRLAEIFLDEQARRQGGWQ